MGYIIYTDRQLKLYLLADRPWHRPIAQYSETLFTTKSLRPVVRPIGLSANRNRSLHSPLSPHIHIPLLLAVTVLTSHRRICHQLIHFSSWL